MSILGYMKFYCLLFILFSYSVTTPVNPNVTFSNVLTVDSMAKVENKVPPESVFCFNEEDISRQSDHVAQDPNAPGVLIVIPFTINMQGELIAQEHTAADMVQEYSNPINYKSVGLYCGIIVGIVLVFSLCFSLA